VSEAVKREEANMLKLVSKLALKRTQKLRDRDYGDLRGPFAEALESELARLDSLTKAFVIRRR
jgi:hypothetical protein